MLSQNSLGLDYSINFFVSRKWMIFYVLNSKRVVDIQLLHKLSTSIDFSTTWKIFFTTFHHFNIKSHCFFSHIYLFVFLESICLEYQKIPILIKLEVKIHHWLKYTIKTWVLCIFFTPSISLNYFYLYNFVYSVDKYELWFWDNQIELTYWHENIEYISVIHFNT